MSNFWERKAEGRKAEEAFVRFFKSVKGTRVVKTGYDNGGNEAFCQAYNYGNGSEAAKAIVKTPDFLLTVGEEWAWAEIKNSTKYERAEYEHHKLLTDSGQRVLLFMPRGDDLVGFGINDLVWLPADNVFRKLSTWDKEKIIPSEGHWLYPNVIKDGWTEANSRYWRAEMHGSGNPYGRVDVWASKVTMTLPNAMIQVAPTIKL